MEYVLRPLAVLVLFALAWGLAALVTRLIPEGRIKRYLTRKHEVMPTSDESAKDWMPTVYLFIASAIIFGIIGLLSA